MAIFKVTMIFNQITVPDPSSPAAPRSAGWSESWYVDAFSVQGAIVELMQSGGLAQARSRLLANTASIVGQRIQPINPLGPVTAFSNVLHGAAGVCDIPQMALYYSVDATVTAKSRKLELRGIPDARIVGGAYSRSKLYDSFVSDYAGALQGYKWFGQDGSLPKYSVVSITAGGLVSLKVANPFVVNAQVHFTTVRDDLTKQTRPYQTGVLALGPGANQFQLASWPYGAASGGKVQLYSVIALTVAAQGIGLRATTRKTGRPFDLYRGRVPTRTQ